MKYLISISILFFLLTSGIKAQQARLDTLVNLKFGGITLKQALHELSQKFSVNFSYSDSKIPINKKIYAEYSSRWLYDVLSDMFHQHEINYSIIENQIVLFPFDNNQTMTATGKVVNALDGSPIPFANIALTGTTKGTSSNEDGEFTLSLTKLPAELMISHLSYEKKLVNIYDETNEPVIQLIPAPRQLQEVTVKARRNKNIYYNLVKKAYDKLGNAKTEMKYGKAFYRQKSKRENTFTEIFEIFYDIKYSDTGIEDWVVQEGRYAFQNNNEYDIFLYNKNFTLLSRMFPIRQPETESYIIPVNPDVKKLYDLDLKEVIKFDERLIGVISFVPKPEVVLPAASGELYIDFDNYQVLKMKGNITNENLDIVGFNDHNSTWKNYQLEFEVSFIDDPADQLLMDYVRIDHSFDYFFKEEFIGKINTSSLLSFYEHYTPVKNKRLGGAINYKSSDMEVIDGVGYNPLFWSQNPIVKRTPLEEKVINDFEQNEAFGVVFMNNEEEVILLPDKKNSEKARKLISRFESTYSNESGQRLILRLDQINYSPEDQLRFSAYVLDSRALKSFNLGSVLHLELYGLNNELISASKYDINNGIAYGEFDLSQSILPGKYLLKAYTNLNVEDDIEQEINILNIPQRKTLTTRASNNTYWQDLNIQFFPESGNLVQGINSTIVFIAKHPDGVPIKSEWNLVDNSGNIHLASRTNELGVGVFDLKPQKDYQYFLTTTNTGVDQKWPLPTPVTSGITMKLDHEKLRSIHVKLEQKPALPKTIYLLCSANGKVFSFYEKKLNGSDTNVDLPIQHMPGGVNTLLAMNEAGTILTRRTHFIPPDKLNIRLESASWTSKRKNRAKLVFKISNQNGKPTQANLSAVCSTTDLSDCEGCDIRNQLYFGNLYGLDKIDMSRENDSIYTLIDHLLFAYDSEKRPRKRSIKSETRMNQLTRPMEEAVEIFEPVVAEVNVSGNFSSRGRGKTQKLVPRQARQKEKNDVYWIPSLNIDEHGVTSIDYKTENKNQAFYVNIQGISQNGHVGYFNTRIDPEKIKSWKK